MKELFNNDAFLHGVIFGMGLYQQKVIAAHRRNEPLAVGDETYYLQTGQEKLQEMVDRVCR